MVSLICSPLFMKTPPSLPSEAQRLDRLRGLAVLDTEAEGVLDAITRMAALAAQMPVSLVSLVDQDRQWWKSAVGLPQGAHTPRDISFCGHAIAGDALFEVEDATQDERFFDNPIVTGAPHVIHYAAMPLVMPGGERIGTLCVIDHKPGRIDERTRAFLAGLASLVVRILLLRESDITQRRRLRAEDALRESEARFRTITDAMPQMVWSALADGRLDYFNQGWYDFTGASPDQPAVFEHGGMLHPQDEQRVRDVWRHSIATGEPYQTEYRLRHRSGEYKWVLGRALPVRGDGGAIVRWMGTCTDIHEQRLVQEELRAVNSRKDEFLAMLAHELRNPLAPISTAAEILQLLPGDQETVLQSSALIGRQVRQLTTLVDDLLDASRFTRGMVELRRDLTDLKPVISNALEQAQPLMQARRHSAVVQLCPAPAFVLGDAVRLVQVLTNLLNNAAKYTPEGGLITVELSTQESSACISVSDNGSGIEPDLLPQVFALFTQARRTQDRAQGGLGLGLALVKSIIGLHGGSVSAESAGRGQGSTFAVRLPLAAPGPQAAAPAAPDKAKTPRSLRVMVVDDNQDAAESLGIWLRRLGHEVTVLIDALAALATAREAPAEVYVLDIGLPVLDGCELAQLIRHDPGNRGATLIALTGYGQPGDIQKSRDAGFDHHLVKPGDLEKLTTLLAGLA